MNLSTLPASVFSEITRFFEDVHCVARLDSAFCTHQHREIWLQLFRSNDFILRTYSEISDVWVVRWLVRKGARSSNVWFANRIKDHTEVTQYLRESGSCARSVQFERGKMSHEMVLVALYCKKLTSLVALQSTLTSAFTDILLSNPDIKEIRCADGTFGGLPLLEGIAFDELKIFSICGLDGFQIPWREVAQSPSLHTVIFNCNIFRHADLRALFTGCPRLRSFRSDYVNTSVGGELLYPGVSFSSMSGLVNLSCANNDGITDQHVLSIAQTLTLLRTLNVRDCAQLTDASLRHLAENAGDRLTVLYTDIKHPEHAQIEVILNLFSQKCVKLRYLNVKCGNKSLCARQGTSYIVCGCPALRTLVVDKHSTIGTAARRYIARFRPELHVLVHNVNTTCYNIEEMPID